MSRPEIRAGLDTSVLMRLLTGDPVALADAARDYLAEVEEAGAALYVANLVVAEAYFACQHHYGMPKAAVLEGLRVLLSMPTFVVHPALPDLLAKEGLAKAKPGFVDRLILADYAAAGLTMVTFEKTARRLSGVRVLSALEECE